MAFTPELGGVSHMALIFTGSVAEAQGQRTRACGMLVSWSMDLLKIWVSFFVTRSLYMVSIGNQVNHQKLFAVRLIMSDLTIRICPERCKSSSFRGAGSF